MSTFNGFVSEFPHIRIDCFRTLPGKSPPLACFLSHVHSDHLAGLESLKSPFVYCSPTTRELLLRLEKYPHRMNYQKGILECRKQTYKHLRTLLKPIPLETPTRIELSPGNDIQVTLFDANHCAGAVMFLIEGQGKAVLYTGDIRSEEWFVNNFIRHPKVLPYLNPSKRLDKIYLDTTFAVKDDPYRTFPTKATGLQELLQKLERYPPSTMFYFQAWTFGYEDVWLVLSQALQSPIHLDRYRYRLYTSVARNRDANLDCPEGPVLCGFRCGNAQQPGILTTNPDVRLHSCEKGAGCDVGDRLYHDNVVTITPVISRYAGVDMRELGAGGGQGDLDQIHELDLSEPMAIGFLIDLCTKKIKDPELLQRILKLLTSSLLAEKGRLQFEVPEFADVKLLELLEQDAIPLDQLPKLIADMALSQAGGTKPDTGGKTALPKSITFPYSRHSSYGELRHLVNALRPRDVWPCTAVPPQVFTEERSMRNLFGEDCDLPEGKDFAFDVEMRLLAGEWKKRKRRRKNDRTSDAEESSSEGERLLDETRKQPKEQDNDTEDEDEFQSAAMQVDTKSSGVDGASNTAGFQSSRSPPLPSQKSIPVTTDAPVTLNTNLNAQDTTTAHSPNAVLGTQQQPILEPIAAHNNPVPISFNTLDALDSGLDAPDNASARSQHQVIETQHRPIPKPTAAHNQTVPVSFDAPVALDAGLDAQDTTSAHPQHSKTGTPDQPSPEPAAAHNKATITTNPTASRQDIRTPFPSRSLKAQKPSSSTIKYSVGQLPPESPSTAQPSSAERFRIRQEAQKKARSGRWHEIELECMKVRRKPVDEPWDGEGGSEL